MRSDHEAEYRAWRAAHPEVYALFQRFAHDALRRGRRFGIGFLAERVRWEVHTTWSPDAHGFKLNNNYRAYIARDLLAEAPALAGLLETRRSAGDGVSRSSGPRGSVGASSVSPRM